MSENEQIVKAFIAAWSRLDVEELTNFFTDDGVYHNMPMAPVRGKQQLRAFISAFLKDWSRTDWDILTIIGKDDTVVAERLDRTIVGEKQVDLPCCGVFQIKDGKIAVWRDYFDMATYTNALKG